MSAASTIARTPEPPYYAVIFTSRRTAGDRGYDEMAARMVELGSRYDGFLGIESARGADGGGITVSYWRDEAAIRAWKQDAEHQKAQRGGRATWYAEYHVRVAKVERAYGGSDPARTSP
ncbi:MAG TPA: antibiotic biosynthesis monooxygenase [Opitutus sp.]|nr:antibiotic biosynthesis monooxygenase [Opitutus sp.]